MGINVTSQEPIQHAYEMLRHEHTRWNQWAVFFLGSIASIFAVWQTEILKALVPSFAVTMIASIMSLAWVLAALGIKRSTNAWRNTILDLEGQLDGRKPQSAMLLFEKYVKQSAFHSGIKIQSVTSMLLLFGVISCTFFSAVTIVLICHDSCGR